MDKPLPSNFSWKYMVEVLSITKPNKIARTKIDFIVKISCSENGRFKVRWKKIEEVRSFSSILYKNWYSQEGHCENVAANSKNNRSVLDELLDSHVTLGCVKGWLLLWMPAAALLASRESGGARHRSALASVLLNRVYLVLNLRVHHGRYKGKNVHYSH